MKAYICDQYGPPEVLKLRDVEKPSLKSKEVLIKVKASTVNAADCNIRGLTYIPKGMGFVAKLMLGVNKPKIAVQGSVLAGDVVEVGDEVKQFKPGDKVFSTGPHFGGYGEFAVGKASGAISLMPGNISYEEAATVPYGGLTALYFLKNMADIQKGQKVMVIGASGGVGVYAVQLASYFGAEVTGVCSTKNIDFVKSLGARRVIDYTKEDLTQLDEKWDIILDVVVKKTSFKKYKGSLTKNGLYLAVAGGIGDMLQMIRTSITGGKKVKFGGGEKCEIRSNLDFLARLIEENKIKPVLDKTFEFKDMVEAHRYAESGAKKGNIAITVGN